jgi:ribose transport system substrate-binding protein
MRSACLITTVLVLLAGVTTAQVEEHKKGTVIYLAPTLFDEFQTESMAAMQSMLGSIGYKVRTLDAQNRADMQLNQLENALLMSPVALIVAAVDFDSVVPGIEKARSAGIPVVIYDRQITSTVSDLSSVAGTIEIGRLAGAAAVELLQGRHGKPTRGSVLQILGDPGDSYTLEIQKGFDEVLELHPQVEVTTKAAMQWEATHAGDIAEDHLLVKPETDLIFPHAGHLAIPIVATLEAKGKRPGDVLMLTSGGSPVGLEMIRQGWMQVDVEQPLYAQVYGIAMCLDRLIAGDSLKVGTYDVTGLAAVLSNESWGPNLKIPGRAVTKANVNDKAFWGNLTPPKGPVKIIK